MHRLALLALVGVVGCASASTVGDHRDVTTVTVGGAEGGTLRIRNETETSSGIIALPIAKVWAALPAVFDSLGITPTTIDPTKRLIGTEGAKLRQRIGGIALSRFFDCGTTQVGPNADSYEVLIMVYAQLKTAPANTTTVEVTVNARARPVAFRQGYSDCQPQSRTLDAHMIELIRRQANR